MKKLLVATALIAAAIAPTAASAADPAPADFKNAAKYCKALKAASGTNNFATLFGTKKNAYGKCVSSTAKKAARTNAAEACQAEKAKRGNAFGKCVSAKAKALKAAADQEDEAQEDDRVNAAKSCKTAKTTDAAKFAADYGTTRNAYGKCVSKTARQLAAERKAEEQAAPTA
jgi:hypothetical protein